MEFRADCRQAEVGDTRPPYYSRKKQVALACLLPRTGPVIYIS